MYVLTYLELKQFKNCNEATVHWSTIRNEAEVSSRESVVSVLSSPICIEFRMLVGLKVHSEQICSTSWGYDTIPFRANKLFDIL